MTRSGCLADLFSDQHDVIIAEAKTEVAAAQTTAKNQPETRGKLFPYGFSPP
jgi:hypothetical protein